MSRRTDEAFEALLVDWFDERAHGPSAEAVVEGALSRTARLRPRPSWLARVYLPTSEIRPWVSPLPRLVVVFVLIALLVLAAVFLAGSQRKLPPPFGVAGNGAIAYGSHGQIWVSSTATGEAHPVTFDAAVAFVPVWSRDGTRIAYRRLSGNEPSGDPTAFQDLVVVASDGSNPVEIEHAAPALSNPSWSGDGRWLAYTRGFPPGHDRLVIAASDGSGATDLGDLGGSAWGPVWAPDNEHLAVAIENRVVMIDRDGGGIRQLNRATFDEVGAQGVVGDWSPDGRHLAFPAGIPDHSRVYIVGLDGSPETPLGLPGLNQTDASWSPDGTRIAYLRSGTGVGPVVVIADGAGHDLRVLAGFYAWSTPIWSPDGRRVVVVDDKPGTENVAGSPVLVVLDPDGREASVTIPLGDATISGELPDTAASWQRVAP